MPNKLGYLTVSELGFKTYKTAALGKLIGIKKKINGYIVWNNHKTSKFILNVSSKNIYKKSQYNSWHGKLQPALKESFTRNYNKLWKTEQNKKQELA